MIYSTFKAFLLAFSFIYVIGGLWLFPFNYFLPEHFDNFVATTRTGRLIERFGFLFSCLTAICYVHLKQYNFKSLLPSPELNWGIKIKYFVEVAFITFFCLAVSYLTSLFLGFIEINYISNNLIVTNFSSSLWNIFLMGVIGHSLVALGEETVYRGVVFRYLLEKTNNVTFALLFSAFIFSLFHFHYETPFSFLIAFSMGYLLALIYFRYGSLLYCISIHWTYNLFMHIFTPNSKNYLIDYFDISLQEIPGWGDYFSLIRIITLTLVILIFLSSKSYYAESVVSG